jgi:hypothetical protein
MSNHGRHYKMGKIIPVEYFKTQPFILWKKMGVKLKKRVTFQKYFTDNRNYCGK